MKDVEGTSIPSERKFVLRPVQTAAIRLPFLLAGRPRHEICSRTQVCLGSPFTSASRSSDAQPWGFGQSGAWYPVVYTTR